jgi:hypothetical protein
VLGHEARDRVRGGRGFDPAHRAAAATTRIDVGGKDVFEQPAPPRAWRASLGVVVGLVVALVLGTEQRQRERIGLAWWRAALGQIDGGVGDDLGPERGVAREYAEIPEQMEVRRWHSRNETGQQVERLEDECARAVFPDVLQVQPDAAVGTLLESLLGDGGAGDVLAKALELPSVAAIDELLGMHVDASH